MSAAIHSDYDDFESRRDHWLYLIGRLKPGLSRQAAESSSHAVFSGIMQNIERSQFQGTAQAREQYVSRRLLLGDGARGQQPYRDDMIPVFILLFSSTGIVVLIACANIANLLLARGVVEIGRVCRPSLSGSHPGTADLSAAGRVAGSRRAGRRGGCVCRPGSAGHDSQHVPGRR